MDRARTLAHQTVVVRDGRIVALGEAGKIAIPADARRVDARGKWLMPGLVDMHAHAAPGTESLGDPAGRQLAMYLASGFTTVRSLGGPPTALALRDRIRAGELLGPALVVASSSINGRSAPTPADVVRKVEEAKRAGYDLVKTHGDFPTSACYDSLVAATARVGLPLSGHVTPDYGLRKAMAAHQQVEHLDGFIAEVMKDGAAPPPPGQFVVDAASLDAIDHAKIRSLARDMARQKIWNGPTIALFALVASDVSADSLAKDPAMRYVPRAALAAYARQKTGATSEMPAEGRHRYAALREEMVRALYEAGAKLLVGSDSPQFFMVPGDAAVREIEALAALGLPSFAVLEAATRNPAEYLGRASDVGTVAVGKRADLILLDADPLADVRNVRRLSGVMANGRWLDADRLASLREGVAAALPE
jgi:imidazolonepropionase-like amidohydrolase